MEVKQMSGVQKGQMSSKVLEVSSGEGGNFALTMGLADGRTLHTDGRLVVTVEGESSSPRSFKFDSEEFHREVMMGNIDIRAVCAKLERLISIAS
jgi:hypothetical protein